MNMKITFKPPFEDIIVSEFLYSRTILFLFQSSQKKHQNKNALSVYSFSFNKSLI